MPTKYFCVYADIATISITVSRHVDEIWEPESEDGMRREYYVPALNKLVTETKRVIRVFVYETEELKGDYNLNSPLPFEEDMSTLHAEFGYEKKVYNIPLENAPEMPGCDPRVYPTRALVLKDGEWSSPGHDYWDAQDFYIDVIEGIIPTI